MRRPNVVGWLTAVAGMVVLAVPLAAQDPAAAPRPDTTELVFEREVFSYPAFTRRNPFKPLVSDDDSGPRFEELRLLGVVMSPDPDLSVALVGVGTENFTPEAAGGDQYQTYRLRRGMVLGNTRILEIQRMRVIVEVEEFGLTEQRELELQRPNEGGLS